MAADKQGEPQIMLKPIVQNIKEINKHEDQRERLKPLKYFSRRKHETVKDEQV